MNNYQLEADAEFSRHFQGHCLKAIRSLEALPMRAHDLLGASIFLIGEEREERWISVGNSKNSLHDLAGIARKIETWIECLGGPKAKPFVSKLTDEEIAKRIAGEYSDQRLPPPEYFSFSDEHISKIRAELERVDCLDLVHFISSAEESISFYQHGLWRGGKPNNREDKDKLNTLLGQVSLVVDKFDSLIPMVMRPQYRQSEWGIEDDLKKALHSARHLYHGCQDALENLKKHHGKKKPQEYQLADDLAYCYWRSFNMKPSHDPRASRFMNVLLIIEEAMGTPFGGNRILGEDLIESVLDGVFSVPGANTKTTDTPEDKK